MKKLVLIPIFLAFFVVLLYLLGKFMTIDVGGYFTNLFEGGIRRLPLVRNVYSAAKQISDFIFSSRQFNILVKRLQMRLATFGQMGYIFPF